MFLVSICRLGILEPAVELRQLRYFMAVDVIEIDIGRGALEDAVEKSERNLQPGITDPFAPFSVSAFGLLEC
jgi:hypothetical protein